ncbi:hypothetical protein NBRC110019_07610 [Neptunitalea chrysea]|uniref:Uncharacterized protein n=1 Tax=Neptunitalea chrysea TaxID=1647581 RepID=A0A9W6B4K0_9FLAO|nr:hypothetical protein [Neptunitalea chrysea]GLB51722.1 hypothetical protein NBRC110019_07610 [Neptunitalea chrysea]
MKAVKIIILSFVGLFIFLVLFGLLAPETEYEANIKKQKVQDSIEQAEKLAEQKKIDAAIFEKNVRIVDSLKKDFLFEEDEFNDQVWINHKRFGKYWPNRNALVVYIRKDGSYYLQSNYHGSDWVFHQNIKVKLGNDVITSENINTFDKRHKTDLSGGDVWEVNQYTNNSPDVAKAIAHYTGKEPVKVRFQGEQNIEDFTLSSRDKKAIEESIIFAEALQNTWNKIGGPTIP